MKKPAAKTAGLIFENRNLKCRLPYLASFRRMTDMPIRPSVVEKLFNFKIDRPAPPVGNYHR